MPRIPLPSTILPPSTLQRQRELAQLAAAEALHEAGRLPEADAAFQSILAANPRHAAALAHRGLLAIQRRDFAAAVPFLDRSLQINPNNAQVHNARGVALSELGQFEAALADLNRAVSLGHQEGFKNRCIVLVHLSRFEAALADCEKAIALDPEDLSPRFIRIAALEHLGRLQDALDSLDEFLLAHPDHAEASFHKGEILLLQGRYPEGWALFERRMDTDSQRDYWRDQQDRRWSDGVTLSGKTVLLRWEKGQGFGDIIQFCRYVPLIEALGASVLLDVPKPVRRLMAGLDGHHHVLDDAPGPPAFDTWIPLMSLPLVLGTTVETIPAPNHYLRAEPTLTADWATRLGAWTGPRVGIVWSGSKAGTLAYLKSMPLTVMARLQHCGPRLYSLQRHDEAWAPRPGELGGIVDLGGMLDDFATTAAVIENLDLVISIDTAVAHLAGALGKPVWVLLFQAGEWRWQSEGSVSPWYPTARLFRQRTPGGWDGVIDEVATALQAWAADWQPASPPLA